MRQTKRYIKDDNAAPAQGSAQGSRAKVKNLVVKSIELKTPNQEKYVDEIYEKTIIVGSGCPGTGKTFLAVHTACQMLADREIEQIILTKPLVEVGKSMGALPGDADEKMAPFIMSVEDCFSQVIGIEKYHDLISRKVIRILPLNFMRGLTLKNCMVIADEMQNSTPAQMKALLTRIGEESIFVLNGDLNQADLAGDSGLAEAIRVLSRVSETGHVEFGVDDIVRSGILKEIIISYMEEEKK